MNKNNIVTDEIADDRYVINENKKNVGLYLDSPVEFVSLDRIPEFVGWFENWYGNISVNKLAICGNDHVALPFITWQPTNISFEEIIDGKHDEYIIEFFSSLADICDNNDILIRFAHEMELRPLYDPWYSWQGLDPHIYIETWRHVVEIGNSISPNFKWVWSPNRCDSYSDIYYPSDEYVDYIGVTANVTKQLSKKFRTFKTFYIDVLGKDNLEKYDKRVIICELGYNDDKRKSKFLKSVFDYYKNDDNIVLISFFNFDVDDDSQYKITDNIEYMNIFYDGIDRLNFYR